MPNPKAQYRFGTDEMKCTHFSRRCTDNTYSKKCNKHNIRCCSKQRKLTCFAKRSSKGTKALASKFVRIFKRWKAWTTI